MDNDKEKELQFKRTEALIKKGILIKCPNCHSIIHKGNYCEQCGHKLNPNKKPANNGKLDAEKTVDFLEKKITEQNKNAINHEYPEIF